MSGELVLRALSLCAGIGGLDLALKPMGVRTVCYVERDSFAAAVLVAQMERKALDCAPVHSDLQSFDGRAWRGVVDCVTAGFPCQPVSVSGSRAGTDDERWIWPLIERILDDVQPRYVFLENVPGLLSLGASRVFWSLAKLGFDAEWTCLPASAVGATHERNRWFCLAYRDANASRELESLIRVEREGSPQLGIGSDELAYTTSPRLERTGRVQGHADDGCGAVEHTANTTTRSELPRFPPGPGDTAWEGIIDGWPHLEPSICRVAHGISYHVDRLRCLGNAVVPAQASAAFQLLWRRMNSE